MASTEKRLNEIAKARRDLFEKYEVLEQEKDELVERIRLIDREREILADDDRKLRDEALPLTAKRLVGKRVELNDTGAPITGALLETWREFGAVRLDAEFGGFVESIRLKFIDPEGTRASQHKEKPVAAGVAGIHDDDIPF